MTRRRRRHPLQLLWMPLAATAFLGYFGFHAFNGAFGIWSMERLEVEGAELAADLDAVRGQRLALEKRVSLVRPESLDADLADTTARATLNLMRPDELLLSPAAPR